MIADLIEDTARIVLDGDGLGDDGDARDAPRQFGGLTRVLFERRGSRYDPDGAREHARWRAVRLATEEQQGNRGAQD